MCNHENREAAMVRIQGTPVPGVTTKVGFCDPCLHPLVQALNDGGQYTFASCCGHGHRPGWIALADDRWLVVATEEQRHVIDAAFPVDINGRVWDQAEDGLAERVRDWRDWPHEFVEDTDDGSMCICGVPALTHDAAMERLAAQPDTTASDKPKVYCGIIGRHPGHEWDNTNVADAKPVWFWCDGHDAAGADS